MIKDLSTIFFGVWYLESSSSSMILDFPLFVASSQGEGANSPAAPAAPMTAPAAA